MKKLVTRNSSLAIGACAILLTALIALLWVLFSDSDDVEFIHVSTVAGNSGDLGEPFGIAVKGREFYVSDGQHGKIWRVSGDKTEVFAEGLHTPSAITFDNEGNLIVADSGTHTIKSINSSGEVSTIAGVEGKAGFADGDTTAALFYAPIGIAIDKGKTYVADTYNDKIRVVENGKVSTLAKDFDTPTGLAVWRDKLLVADTGNRMIRVIESDGFIWTLAGNGDSELKNGLLLSASFVQPTAIVVDKNSSIFVTDGNAIRQIDIGVISTVSTITAERRGLKDGTILRSQFNRPSGLVFDGSGDLLVADSENRVIRRISRAATLNADDKSKQANSLNVSAEEFRNAAPARWPFDPPDVKRDIAGTLGEIRGEMTEGNDQVWFHNGLDIAGAYGETARFIRDEKVLRPVAVDNFGNLRESLRMPTLGYIHIRIGRDSSEKPFDDTRFLFTKEKGKLAHVRIPRGTQFKAGEAIGTLNSMNHVHLIAGRSGSEMNALDALTLPNLTDTRPPTIEKVTLLDENNREIETTKAASRIKLSDKIRIVASAFDQVDGNAERRRLGVYKLGYQLLKTDGTPMSEVNWTILFDRFPPHEAVPFVYANGSKSGATGETIFDYIVTNFVNGDDFRKSYFDATTIENGNYTIRVVVADYFGNESYKDIDIEVLK